MKIKFSRDENGISALIVKDGENDEKLSNLKLIDEIYAGRSIDLVFDEKILDEEKTKIKTLIESLIALKSRDEE